MKKIILGLASVLVFSASPAFAESVQFDPETGYDLDDNYYSAPEGDAQPVLSTRNAKAEQPFAEPFELKVLSKGAYTYHMKVSWQDADGSRKQFSRDNVFAWVPLVFTIPKGAKHVLLTTNVDDGFFGRDVIAAHLTPALVAEHKPHYTEFHMWGSTLWPKWRRMD